MPYIVIGIIFIFFFLDYRFNKQFTKRKEVYSTTSTFLFQEEIQARFQQDFELSIEIEENTEIDAFIPSKEKIYLTKTKMKENLYTSTVFIHEMNHALQWKENYFPLTLYIRANLYKKIMTLLCIFSFFFALKVPVVGYFFLGFYLLNIFLYLSTTLIYEWDCHKRTNRLLDALYQEEKIEKDEYGKMKEIQKNSFLLYVLYIPLGFI